jgi:hypothetical protein
MSDQETTWQAEATDEGWETVSDESPTRIIFDEIGDVFIGTYEGHEYITDPNEPESDPFDYIKIRGTDGKPYIASAGFRLIQAFEKIEPGSMVRITYVKDVDMGVAGRNPMKDYKVDIKRA